MEVFSFCAMSNSQFTVKYLYFLPMPVQMAPSPPFYGQQGSFSSTPQISETMDILTITRTLEPSISEHTRNQRRQDALQGQINYLSNQLSTSSFRA